MHAPCLYIRLLAPHVVYAFYVHTHLADGQLPALWHPQQLHVLRMIKIIINDYYTVIIITFSYTGLIRAKKKS